MDAIEGPAGMPPMGAPEMDNGNPVTMNVSINASGKDHVEDLIDMMKNAGMDAKEVSHDHMPMRMDMERLRDLVDEPGHEDTDEAYSPGDENAEGVVSNCCGAPVQDERGGTGRCSACGEGCEAVAEESIQEGGTKSVIDMIANADDPEQMVMDLVDKGGPIGKYLYKELEQLAVESGKTFNDGETDPAELVPELLANMGIEEGYDNEPDVRYGDTQDAIPDGNDLNRKKKAYAAAQDGDNAMAVEAIKATLMKALAEKKMPMGPGPDGKKGTDDDKPAFLNQKTGDKKSKGGSKPKKGVVPPQFKKK